MTILVCLALFLTTLGLWFGPRIWIPMWALAIALGYASGVLVGPAVFWIALLAGFCFLYTRLKAAQRRLPIGVALGVTALGIVTISILLALHALPGFRNFLVARDLILSAGAAPYTLYLNFDKTAVGILILGIVYRPPIDDRRAWLDALKRAAPILVLTVGVLIILSLAAGYLRFDPKWHSLFWIWAPANLLLTCLSEEAFFRGFIQRELHTWLEGPRHAQWIAIAASAVSFGLAHFAGGWTYVFLASVAGLGYALVYWQTGRIEMAILTHFVLNATHFLLFTYPRIGI